MTAAVLSFGIALLVGVLVAVAVQRGLFARGVTALLRTTGGRAAARRVERAVSPPHAAAKALAVLLIWLLFVIVLGWSLGLASSLGPQPGDRPILSWFMSRRSDWLTDVMVVVTWLGDSIVLVAIATVVGVLWRWWRGSWRALLVSLGAYAGAAVAFNAVKVLTSRVRPDSVLLAPPGTSFPSGHAVDASAVYLALVLVAAWVVRGYLLGAIAGVVAAAVSLVLVSRVYLAVHWLSDVVAGVVLGALWTSGLLGILVSLWGGRWREVGSD